MQLGKHKELSKALQHKVGFLLHSSLNDQVVHSSRHVRSKSEFDNENDFEIDLNRNELNRGFLGKTEREERVCSANI